jgi:hypothetical protein
MSGSAANSYAASRNCPLVRIVAHRKVRFGGQHDVPVPQFKATAKLGEFLSQLPA